MSPARKALPSYLKRYIAEQKYDAYTSRDQAAWRYIMRQNRAFFSRHAVPIYAQGLEKTGIPLTQIPKVSEMDDCLSEFGWGAVPVRGFIPPAAFLDFQARGVLPIACDMRTADHIAYTPAPDIVHEAAGHAPIIADPLYSAYLHRYARMAQKAIYSTYDVRLYEAIRYLSDIKENPDTLPETIAQAEQRLKQVTSQPGALSENAKVVRMSWWTVEYGLVGDLKNPLIYGAGLLSSVGESQNCLSAQVRKIPLTVDCVHTSYDITEPQPQLFVTPTLEHLIPVLEDLEKTMAFVRGGSWGLDQAKIAETVVTTVLSSGLQISGAIADFTADPRDPGQPCFLRCTGPVQLCFADEQLPGQGRERHPQGFSSPLGRWKAAPQRAPESLSDSDLDRLGLTTGSRTQLEFESGFRVSGVLAERHRHQGKLTILTWKDCTVQRSGQVVFEPSWGEFDLAVGEKVVSVFGGPADRGHYGDLDIGTASTTPGRSTPYTSREKTLFEKYRRIRQLREARKGADSQSLQALSEQVLKEYPEEWLLALEIFEMGSEKQLPWMKALQAHLEDLERHAPAEIGALIQKGLGLAEIPDSAD